MALSREQLAVTPAASPPAGLTSNLVDPESRAWHVVLTIGITLVPALILVALRIYARLGLARRLGADDYACFLATAFTITFNGIVLSLLDMPGNGAIGRHIWDVSLLNIYLYQFPAVVDAVFLRISNTLIKVSLLALYLRIFSPLPRLRFMIWAGMVAVVVFCVVVVFTTLGVCTPERPANLDIGSLTVPRRCMKVLPTITTAGTIFSVITDIYILVIPIHIIPSLKLSRRRKAAVGSVFLLGLFACLAGLTNLVIRFERYLPTDLKDFTWNVTDTYITKVAETNIGLICSCMPAVSAVAMGPMRRFRNLFSPLFGRSEAGDPGSRGYRDSNGVPEVNMRGGLGLDIPRGTITGLRTLIGTTPDPEDPRGDSTSASELLGPNGSNVSQTIYADDSRDHDKR
ncbi:hypothetical protein GGS20DRAFT_167985 [Poronia punctata]|nr:hypothetical protein GGS20DRAFT_167985 [Poronia punctata]